MRDDEIGLTQPAEERRRFLLALAAGAAAATLPATASAQIPPPEKRGPKPQIAMLVHPDMILLDLAGPMTVLNLAMTDIHLVWKDLNPVATDVGVAVTPTKTFADCPAELDAIFVPGGLKGSIAAMQDQAVLAFLADRGSRAKYVTSVCTGGLVLGAAGLLKGYRATSHWYVRDLLALMGATVTRERVVEDRNRMTGGGVTAGIDFGLRLAAKIRDETFAKRIQLVLEYDPQPPYDTGAPERAGTAMRDDVVQRRSALIQAAGDAARDAGKRLKV